MYFSQDLATSQLFKTNFVVFFLTYIDYPLTYRFEPLLEGKYIKLSYLHIEYRGRSEKNGKIRPSYVHLKWTDTSINPSILKTKSVHISVHLKKKTYFSLKTYECHSPGYLKSKIIIKLPQ